MTLLCLSNGRLEMSPETENLLGWYFSPNQSDSNGKAFQERPFVQTASVPKKFYFRLHYKKLRSS